MASCFRDSSVSVAEASCSSITSTAFKSPNMSPSIVNTVVYVYNIVLSSSKQVRVEVSWSRNQMDQGICITFNDSATPAFKLNTNSRIFRKLKGSRIVESSSFKIEVLWDLSLSKYLSGPEPVQGYYVIVMVDSEIGLVLGNLGDEAVLRNVEKGTKIAKSWLVVRRDYCSGNTLFSTRAKFTDNGDRHDIAIRCSGEDEWLKKPFFSICVDKEEVIRVERLNWNFRGYQELFLRGVMVELIWDVYDWLMNPNSGSAVFMFRTRSSVDLDNRAQFENNEKVLGKEQDKSGEFSFLIYACKGL